jgi:hypothetical protein
MPNRIAPRGAFDAQTHDAGKPPSKATTPPAPLPFGVPHRGETEPIQAPYGEYGRIANNRKAGETAAQTLARVKKEQGES